VKEIAGHYDSENAAQIEQAQLQLAHSVLAAAGDDGRDAAQLKQDALQMMAVTYERRV
jgi:hypothetical protein